MSLLDLYVRIRQWFQPYYRYYGHEPDPGTPSASPKERQEAEKQARKRSQKSTDKKSSSHVATPPRTEQEAKRSYQPRLLAVRDYPKPLANVITFDKKPSPNTAWCYHDRNVHQVVAHVLPRAGYLCRERSNKERKMLRPKLYPRQNKPFDRTHLIPIGYHGSENDSRLLVGWDSDANRNEFNEFEQIQKKRPYPLYWCAFITRMPYGAKWEYIIYNAETLEPVDYMIHEFEAQFVWKAM